jgi:hypothetical protein
MEKTLIIKIRCNDEDEKYCSEKCPFIDDFFDSCKIFSAELYGDTDDEKYLRCESCLKNEAKL